MSLRSGQAGTETSLRRGLAILETLANGTVDANGLGVTRIAELIGREKSQVSRTLRILAEQGFVERDADTLRYRVGWRFFALAAHAADRRLLAAAAPQLRRVVAALGERAHLSVLSGAEVLTLLSESPPHAVQTVGWIGRSVPVHCTASGRALLLDADPAEVVALLDGGDFHRTAPNAPHSPAEVAERVASARGHGYAIADEEFEPGLVAVAAPVRDFRGAIVAALNVSAPKFRFEGRVDEAGTTVKAVADDVSAELGYRADAHSDPAILRPHAGPPRRH